MTTTFSHHPSLRAEYPQLAAVALRISLVPEAEPDRAQIAALIDRARERLTGAPEGEFPEVQAWRRVFAIMGFKPTQYRSAGEALLRRLRIDGELPEILPIIDVCNAVSVAHAVPIAVFDVAHITGNLTVRYAEGTETFETFGGEIEHPAEGEVVFADDAGHAHARRWPHKQARTSAARPESVELLIVSEAMHEGAESTQLIMAEELSCLLHPMSRESSGPKLVGPAGFLF